MNGDLISRSALLEATRGDHPPFYDGQDVADWQEKCINEAPAVDAEPVRHGEWEDDAYIWRCTLCHKGLLVEDGCADMNYCPHCGAKMDE